MNQTMHDKIINQNELYMIRYSYLELKNSHQTAKSLAGQRTVFYKTNKYFKKLTKAKLLELQQKFKTFYRDNYDDKYTYIDVQIIELMIHYQICRRNINNNFDGILIAEILKKYSKFQNLCRRNYTDVNDEALLNLLKLINNFKSKQKVED